MVTVGYNSSTGKALYNSGNQCEGCCAAPAPIIVTSSTKMYGLDGSGSLLFTADRPATKIRFAPSGNLYAIVGTSIRRINESNGAVISTIVDTGKTLRDIAIDVAGNFYVCFDRASSVSVQKYNSAGSSQWTYDTGYDAKRIAYDEVNDQVVVCNQVTSGSVKDILVAIDGTYATENWAVSRNVNYTPGQGIAIDSGGNIYTDGSIVAAWAISKHNASGSNVWATTTVLGVISRGIAVSNAHNVLYSTNTATGFGEWKGQISGFGDGILDWSGVGSASGVDVDEDGFGYWTAGNFVVKQDPTDGSLPWTSADLGTALSDIAVLGISVPPAWVINTAYVTGGLVTNGGSTYECILGHTAAAADEPSVGVNWETYWVLI